MSKAKRYAINPESLEGCRIRVSFHFKELQRESDPAIRAHIAQYLAEAATALAQLEADAAGRVVM